jgi:succinate dehydrogenase / fumarate reductase flavoprotein subunit
MAQYHRYDTVIVGAGGAGMRAALEAGQRSKTAVLTKLYPTRSHTGAAQGGMCAALANVEEDNWEWHTFDTVKGGDYLVDQDAAEVMCKEAIDAVLDLEKMGLPFNRTPEGRIDQRRFGGHTRAHGEAAVRRSCFAADRTGHMILQTLYQQCVKHEIDFFNEFYVLDLLLTDVPTVDGGTERVTSGVVAYELATGELHVFQAKAVLFATGGFGKVFKVTSNAHTLTGDGMGIVYRKGLPLEDMEFFQFHPTGIWKMGILLTEGARGEGGILRNKDGERFMERYAPTIKDLAPRDMVARAIYTEIRQGRGCGPAGDHVFLDLTHLPPEQLDAKLPDITEFARTYLGIEPYHDPIPIQPTAHYAMGGVPTNIDGQVLRDNTHTVPGLYAAGEVACVSVHGANRLGTNSLLDINVFGRRGGMNAAEYANRVEFVDLPPEPEKDTAALLQRLRDGGGTELVAAIRAALQETMDANASVYRTEATLKQAEVDIAELKARYLNVGVADRGRRYNTELLEAVELGFLLDLAECLVISAKARNESRGGHFREDYPHRDDVNFMRHTMAYKVLPAGETSAFRADVHLDYKPVVQTRYQPMERKY